MKAAPGGPTRASVSEWVGGILGRGGVSIEQLGDGEAYCRILNHYAPGTILPCRIIHAPTNEYESAINLKHLQTALSKLQINIPFDIHRLTRKKFNENWALASHLYKALAQHTRRAEQDSRRADHEARRPEQGDKAEQEERRDISEVVYCPPSKVSEPTSRPCLEAPPSSLPESVGEGRLLCTIDRVKEVILATTHDTEKIRRIR